MKKIRVGIIGQGRSGRSIHGLGFDDPAMREMFQIVGVTDSIPERCREACEEHPGCRAYTDYHEMLKDRSIDLVVNSTFNDQHVPVSIECMESGFDVVCEKPAAYTLAAMDKLIACRNRTKRFISIFQEARLEPPFQKIMEVVKSGKLGRIFQINLKSNGFNRRWDWQTLQCREAGSLSNNGPHKLDQALALLDFSMPERIVSVLGRANTFGDADDYVKILLLSKDRPVVDVEVSSCAAYPADPVQIYAELGGLTVNSGCVKWKYFKRNEAPLRKLIATPLEGRSYCSEKLHWYEESWCDPAPVDAPWLARRYYEQLYRTLTEGAPFYCTLEQVRLQIAIIEECHRQNPLPELRGIKLK